jgi:prolyl-tRNA synthetase
LKVALLFGSTSKDTSKVLTINSQEILVRAGYIKVRQNEIIGLPLFTRSIRKIIDLVNVHLEDAQELFPFQYLQEDLIILETLNEEINSYKQLPNKIMTINTEESLSYNLSKGLINAKNNLVYRLYSLFAKEPSIQFADIIQTWLELFAKVELPIKRSRGLRNHSFMGSTGFSEEIFYSLSEGNEEYVSCSSCDTTQRIEVADFLKNKQLDDSKEGLLKIVSTPNIDAIDSLSNFLKISPKKCAKVVFYKTETSQIIMAIVRGDMEVNEFAVKEITNSRSLYQASKDEIYAIGAVPGYASPIGIKQDKCLVIIDDLITHTKNMVTGANQEDYHYLNANYDRDLNGIIANIAKIPKNARCKTCEKVLKIENGVKILSYYDNQSKEISYFGQSGKPEIISCFQSDLNLTRLFACLAEYNLDENGFIFPALIAPYQIYLLQLGKKENAKLIAERLYRDLSKKFEILYDDRNLRPGIKFADADLRGIPLRLVISDRLIEEEKIEIKWRDHKTKSKINISEIDNETNKLLS